MLGMLSPAARGALLSAVVFTYVFMGALAGYFSGRIYKTMRGFYWKSTALLVRYAYALFCKLNSLNVLWHHSSNSVERTKTFFLKLS